MRKCFPIQALTPFFRFLGEPGSLETGPQAFLVEWPYPNPRIAPHFHDIDQFQVIVDGDGYLGKRDKEKGT